LPKNQLVGELFEQTIGDTRDHQVLALKGLRHRALFEILAGDMRGDRSGNEGDD